MNRCIGRLPMISFLADRLVLMATRHPVPAEGKTRRWIEFDGGRFEVWIERSGGEQDAAPDLYVLKFAGTGGRAERATVHPADVWDDLHAEVWAVNPPGYGGSPGPATMRTLAAVADAALAAIKQQAEGRPVVVTGNSLGTALALRALAEQGADAVVLRNPVPLRELIYGRFGWWNLNVAAGWFAARVPRELCTLRNAARCDAPAVCISSSRDRMVPPRFQEQVLDAYAGPLQLLRLSEADHADPLSEQEQTQYHELLHWLRGQLLLPSRRP